jgi:hypothetical protein
MPVSIFLAGEVISSVMTKDIISDSTDKLYNTLKNLFHYNCSYLREKLETYDLEVKIEIINSYIKKIENTNDNSIQVCLKYIKLIIETINKELEEIKKIIELHQSKWFYNWRTANYYNNLNNLSNHVNILNSRLDLFFKITK